MIVGNRKPRGVRGWGWNGSNRDHGHPQLFPAAISMALLFGAKIVFHLSYCSSYYSHGYLGRENRAIMFMQNDRAQFLFLAGGWSSHFK